MSTGASSGLLDEHNKHAQSVFKHAILRLYIKLFIAMPGSTATNNRVVVLDGFAGKGRYKNGKPASAELILRAIRALKQSRQVTAFFVEKDRNSYESLSQVVSEYRASELDVHALKGKAHDHLDQVVTSAHGAPLFLFLDPCGAGLPFHRLQDVLTGPRQQLRPPTEVLLNFSADLSRRTGGLLHKGNDASWMDTTCGGDWWRTTAREALDASTTGTFEAVTHAVANEYAQRLAAATGSFPVVLPVRRRLHHQPIYHLIFLTRSPYGLWVFADAVARARKEYLTHLGQLEDDDDGMLFTVKDDMEWLVEREHQKAVSLVTENLRGLLSERPRSFKLVNEARSVFGEAYGFATEAAVSAALRTLEASGELTASPARRVRERIVAPTPLLRADHR